MTNSTLTKKEMVMTVLENATTMDKDDLFTTLNTSNGIEYLAINKASRAEWFMRYYGSEYDDNMGYADNMGVDDRENVKILAIGRFCKHTPREEMQESLDSKRL